MGVSAGFSSTSSTSRALGQHHCSFGKISTATMSSHTARFMFLRPCRNTCTQPINTPTDLKYALLWCWKLHCLQASWLLYAFPKKSTFAELCATAKLWRRVDSQLQVEQRTPDKNPTSQTVECQRTYLFFTVEHGYICFQTVFATRQKFSLDKLLRLQATLDISHAEVWRKQLGLLRANCLVILLFTHKYALCTQM